MIRVSVMYPTKEGSQLDWDYYTTTHFELVKSRVGEAIKGVEVDRGMGTAEPGAPALYQGVAHLKFESIDAFQRSFGPHAQEIMGDIPNFSDVQPGIQISEIALG